MDIVSLSKRGPLMSLRAVDRLRSDSICAEEECKPPPHATPKGTNHRFGGGNTDPCRPIRLAFSADRG